MFLLIAVISKLMKRLEKGRLVLTEDQKVAPHFTERFTIIIEKIALTVYYAIGKVFVKLFLFPQRVISLNPEIISPKS